MNQMNQIAAPASPVDLKGASKKGPINIAGAPTLAALFANLIAQTAPQAKPIDDNNQGQQPASDQVVADPAATALTGGKAGANGQPISLATSQPAAFDPQTGLPITEVTATASSLVNEPDTQISTPGPVIPTVSATIQGASIPNASTLISSKANQESIGTPTALNSNMVVAPTAQVTANANLVPVNNNVPPLVETEVTATSNKVVTPAAEAIVPTGTESSKQVTDDTQATAPTGTTSTPDDQFTKALLANQAAAGIQAAAIQPIPNTVVAPMTLTTTVVNDQVSLTDQQVTVMAQTVSHTASEMVNSNDGTTKTLVFRLEPAQLGPINVSLQIDNNQVKVEFKMDQVSTRQVLEAAMPKLQEILKATTEPTIQISNQPTPTITAPTSVAQTNAHDLMNLNQQSFNQQNQQGQHFAQDKCKAYQDQVVELVEKPTAIQEESDGTVSILA